jgi:hypothetical protein
LAQEVLDLFMVEQQQLLVELLALQTQALQHCFWHEHNLVALLAKMEEQPLPQQAQAALQIVMLEELRTSREQAGLDLDLLMLLPAEELVEACLRLLKRSTAATERQIRLLTRFH